MPITIGANIASLGAQRGLGQSADRLSRIYERLSSGQRITHASDDPAGISLGMSLNAQARVANQALRNIQDGISGFAIIEGALTQLTGILQRQQELAEQAANGTYSTRQRQALDSELQALTLEYNRIIESTSFNGTFSLGGSSPVSIQVGTSAVTFEMPNLARIATGSTGDGTFTAAVAFNTLVSNNFGTADSLADFNGDGNLDILVPDASGAVGVLLGNGNGTFSSAQIFTTDADSTSTTTGDFNNDGKIDIAVINSNSQDITVLIGNGNGTFLAGISVAAATGGVAIRSGDLNGDGRLDLVVADALAAGGSGRLRVYLGDGSGNFGSGTVVGAAGSPNDGMILTDVNGDGKLDAVSASVSGSYLGIYLGVGDGTFQARYTISAAGGPTNLTYADVNGDGKSDLITADYSSSRVGIYIGNGDGTFAAQVSYATGGQTYYVSAADLNGDGFDDILSVNRNTATVGILISNGNGTFKAQTSAPLHGNPTSVLPADFNNDGAYDIFAFTSSGATADILMGNTNGSGISFNVLTQSAARTSLTTIQSYQESVARALDRVGSAQSRLAAAYAVTQASEIGYRTAEGRIMDADIAVESANLVKQQILQQAQAAVLGQANAGAGIVLKLLSL